MADTFPIKTGNTSPSLQDTLLDAAGSAVVVTGASVRIHVFHRFNGTELIDAAATIVDGANGIVKYDFQEGDISGPGVFNYEWEVTYADDTVETFPVQGYGLFEIEETLA